MIDRDLTEARALALLSRDQLGRDFFARGVPPKVVQIDTLPDLLAAYARIQRQTPEKRPASALDGVPGHTCPACELRREGLDLTRIDREDVPCNACGGTGLIPIPPEEIVRRAAEAARRDYWPMMEARWKKDAANKRRAAARRAKREAQRAAAT